MNLTAYSSSESEDEINIHSKANISDSNITKTTINNKNIKNNATLITKFQCIQYKNFWSGACAEENWTDETSIWGMSDRSFQAENKPDNTHKRKHFDVTGYISKKSRLNSLPLPSKSHPATNDYETENVVKLNIHPSIRPALCKTARNDLPKGLMASFKLSSEPINRISWNIPDYSHLILSASVDSHVRVTDVFSKTCPLTISSHTKSVMEAAWSPCGSFIASCGYDRMLFVTDIERGVQTFSARDENFLTCLKFHPNDSNLILTGSFNAILGWDTRAPKAVIRKYKHKDRLGQILDVCFSSDSEFISSCDFVSRDTADRCIMIWDFKSSSSISNEIFHEKYTCPRISCHPFKKEFIAQTQGDYIVQFSSEPPYKMNKCKRYNRHRVSGYSIGCDVNTGGNIIASGNSEGQVVLYDYKNTNIMTKIGDPHAGDIALDVSWHPVVNGTLAYSTWDGRVDVWR